MDRSSILDFGGKSNTNGAAISSHLNAGPPSRIADAYHPKRTKYYSEESKQKLVDLRHKVETDLKRVLQNSDRVSSYASVYSDIERLCRAKHSEQASLASFIYESINETISEHVAPKIAECFRGFDEERAEDSAKMFLDICGQWHESLNLLSQLCLYLDRSYLLHHPKNPCIREYGVSTFIQLSLVQTCSSPEDKTSDPLCKMVASLLSKLRANRADVSLKDTLQRLLVFLESFDSDAKLNVNAALHKLILKEYNQSHKMWLKDKKTYPLNFLASLSEDNNILLGGKKSQDFVKKLNQDLKWKYLLSDLTLFVEPALPLLILPENKEYLHVLESYCESSMSDFGSDSLQILCTIWGKHIEEKLRALPLDQDIATNILVVWKESQDVCNFGFMSEDFRFQSRSSFKKALGEKEVSTAVVTSLAKYCDLGMKQGRKPDAVNTEFESNVIAIFNLIPDKSAFIMTYEKDLSKRILMARKFDYAQEKSMIDAIVQVVGENEDNFKIRAMMRDHLQSKAAFSSLRLPSAPQVDFSALVLEKKVWPDIPGFGSDICLPQQLSQPLNDFATMFAENGKHKVLDWNNYTLHQITFTSQFGPETKELQVNLSQAIVLMSFGDTGSISVSQLRELTRMDERLLQRTLSSLSTEKYPILIVEGDLVSINDNFRDKSSKIKLPMGREKDVAVVESVRKLVQEERSSEARAVLVRIMKAHRSLPFTELLGKAIGALESRGTFPVQDLKNEVEHLIQTEYIARDPTGTKLNYIP